MLLKFTHVLTSVNELAHVSHLTFSKAIMCSRAAHSFFSYFEMFRPTQKKPISFI